MRTNRMQRCLAWLALLLTAAPTLSAPDASAEITCEVAVPSECELPGGVDAGSARPSRTVRNLAAGSEAECLERARDTAAPCVRLKGGNADITARFRKGPIESIRQIGAATTASKAISDAVRLPIVYGKNFEAEVEQFGYSPRFAPGVVNFGNDGLPRIRSGKYLQTQNRDGSWAVTDFAAAATAAIRRVADVVAFEWVWDARSAYSDQRIHFDARGRAYTLVQGGRSRTKAGAGPTYRAYLLASRDAGATWTAAAIALPDDRPTWRARIEHNDGNNDRSGPPPLLLFDREEEAAKRSARLFLYVPQWRGDELIVPPATLVSDKSLLIENHSGAANSMVSTADRIYIVYPGAHSLPNMRGTPAYMAVFNKQKAALEGETLIGFGGAAANVDNHNIPGACIGPRETIHVVLPGHQEALRFRIGQIDAAGVTWTPDKVIGQTPASGGGYTYTSLNCDRAGNVFVTSRWAGDAYRFQLVFLHRKPDGAWDTWDGKAHKVLVDPGRPFYGVWRQKVTLDGEGALFLSYAYYANQLASDELVKLKWRFPFQNWEVVKELQPRMCVKGADPRCWLHPMPEVTSAVLKSRDAGASWSFVQ